MGLIRGGWLPIAPPPTASTRSSQDSGAVVQWHSSLGRKGARHCPLAVGPTKGPLLHPPDQVLLGAAVGLSLDHSQTCEWQQYQHKYVNGSSEVVMVAVNRMPL